MPRGSGHESAAGGGLVGPRLSMPLMRRDAPAAVPFFPMGENANLSALQSRCPHRDYKSCFGAAMARRYPSPDLFHVGRPTPEDSWFDAAHYARRRFPGCVAQDARESTAPTARQSYEDDGPGESFTSSALAVPPSERIHPAPPAATELRRQLREASAKAASRDGLDGAALRCGSPIRALDERILLMIGLPTTSRDPRRREAARTSWMRHEAYGRSVCACFLLSAHEPPDEASKLVAEHAAHGDLLLLDAPETGWLIKEPTKYSNYSRAGRGMPTFKQYAFFQHAARVLRHVPYIGKIDDDTAPNLGPMVSLLASIRCRQHALIGAINWAGVIPNAHDTGVRNDRCSFGWGMGDALKNFGTSFGTPNAKKARGNGYFPACDGLGAVPPFPYGTGAGYIFSASVARWIATDQQVIEWVRAAAGPTREELQWQKFEDTSTGYWLSYCPFTIEYINVGRWVHDFVCHPDGARKARGGGLYRPPANTTLLVHNLKHGGFHYAAEIMGKGAEEYVHDDCVADASSVKKARIRDERAARIRERAAEGKGRGGRRGREKGRGSMLDKGRQRSKGGAKARSGGAGGVGLIKMARGSGARAKPSRRFFGLGGGGRGGGRGGRGGGRGGRGAAGSRAAAATFDGAPVDDEPGGVSRAAADAPPEEQPPQQPFDMIVG